MLGCVDEHAVETVVFIEIINQNPLITAQLSQLKKFVPKYENIQQTQSTENNWSQPDTTKRNLKKFREKTLSSSPAQSTHFSSLFAGLWSFLICYILPLFKSCVGRFLLAHYKNVLHVPWYKISLNSIDYPVPPERRRMLMMKLFWDPCNVSDWLRIQRTIFLRSHVRSLSVSARIVYSKKHVCFLFFRDMVDLIDQDFQPASNSAFCYFFRLRIS